MTVAYIARCGTSSAHPSVDIVAVGDVAVGWAIATAVKGKGWGVVASVVPEWRLWKGDRWAFLKPPDDDSTRSRDRLEWPKCQIASLPPIS